MASSILTYILTTIVGILIGYVIKQITEYTNIKRAIRGLLRAEMVNVYYGYKASKKAPFYVKEAWLMNYEVYKELKGNSFIDSLKEEVDNWEVI